jgi:hypothetical protein
MKTTAEQRAEWREFLTQPGSSGCLSGIDKMRLGLVDDIDELLATIKMMKEERNELYAENNWLKHRMKHRTDRLLAERDAAKAECERLRDLLQHDDATLDRDYAEAWCNELIAERDEARHAAAAYEKNLIAKQAECDKLEYERDEAKRARTLGGPGSVPVDWRATATVYEKDLTAKQAECDKLEYERDAALAQLEKYKAVVEADQEISADREANERDALEGTK